MLEIHQLSIQFSSYSFGLARSELQAIRNLELKVEAGEVVAVVGQSGAGKSLLAHALLGILPRNAQISGTFLFKGKLLTPNMKAHLRGKEIALVPQSMTYLNPLLHVGVQIARAAQLSGVRPGLSWQSTLDALQRYRLSHEVARQFPFQLSGGMARRVLTATATIGGADLILADEPTNGLDKESASETLHHLRQLADTGKAVLLITHDIEAALKIADRVSVFYGGVTVEDAMVEDFNGKGLLRHPYSMMLWNAVPNRSFVNSIPEIQPEISINSGYGCPFKSHCHLVSRRCRETLPDMKRFNKGRVRCHHAKS